MPLNNPTISILAAFLALGMGLFVLLKNIKSQLYRIFFFLTFTVWGWFFGNAFCMLFFYNLDTAILWFRIAYTFVPFVCCTYYHTYVVALNRKKTFLYFLYCIAICEAVFLWFTDYISVGAYALPNVGLVWEGMGIFSYFFTFGMFKYLLTTIFVARKFYVQSKKEAEQFKKMQYKNFAIFFFITMGGAIEWLVAFNIPLHIAWVIIPPLLGFFGYSVVKYRFLEIDTVIHKTFLWLMSIFLIIAPASITVLVASEKIKSYLPMWAQVPLFAILLFLFVVYYNKLRPRIDKLFRRKKYAYLELLGAVAQEISGIIGLEELSQKTLTGIQETLYPQTICLLLKDRGKAGYYLKSTFVNKRYKALTKDSSTIFISEHSPIIAFLKKTRQPIERHLLKFDPLYQEIREDAEHLFQHTDTLFLFSLFFEDELVGLLALGRKENLQDYTRLDIKALHNLSLDIASPFYTAFHHQDILEGQRLHQEITLARHIQENFLPQKPPDIPGISVYGLYHPAKEIAGDYYDFIQTQDKKILYIAIGDVSGKGLDAGLIVSSVKSSLTSLIRYNDSPKRILTILNQDIYASLSQQKFVSLLLLKYIPKQNKITYSSAGHQHVLISRAAKTIEVIKSGGVVLGMTEDIEKHLEERTLSLNKGDKILLYTDGSTEAKNPQGERFSQDRLIASLKRHAHLPIKEIIENIYLDIKNFISTQEQPDDITLIGVEKD